YRHESGMADGELAGEPVHQVEARGQDDVDAAQKQDLVDVRIEQVGQVEVSAGHRGQHHQSQDRPPGESLHTFSGTCEPRRPEGRTRRITIRSAKAIASRYVDET